MRRALILSYLALAGLSLAPAAHALYTTVRTSQGTITTRRLANGVRHMVFRWGPVRIAPGQNTISIADDNLQPPGPGWITSFKPNLTYVGGKVPRVDVIHLLHAVWLVASHGDVRPTWAAVVPVCDWNNRRSANFQPWHSWSDEHQVPIGVADEHAGRKKVLDSFVSAG